MGSRTNITLVTSVSDTSTDFHVLLSVLILQRMTAQRKESALNFKLSKLQIRCDLEQYSVYDIPEKHARWSILCSNRSNFRSDV